MIKAMLVIAILSLAAIAAYADGANTNCPRNQVSCGPKQCCVP